MAGSSTSTWTLSVLLLLLPFFISFHQTSAAPSDLCDVTACQDVGVIELEANLGGLRLLKERCSSRYNLNSSLSRLPTAGEACASFPSHFGHRVRNLLSLDLTKCNLQKEEQDDVVKNLKHLEDKLDITNKCPVLVSLYCGGTAPRSAPITSLEGFIEVLTNLLQRYHERCYL